MIIPPEYLDSTCGVRPEPKAPGSERGSFNNIIYTVWYGIARLLKGELSQSDVACIQTHIEQNRDENGLYSPKNSHDNVSYKMIGCRLFKTRELEEMSFFQAVKQIGFYRIWDIILYGAVFGPKVLRPLFSLFLFIPALQMIQSCATEGKVRPSMFEDGKDSRIFWWFTKRKKLMKVDDFSSEVKVYKHWLLSDGTTRMTRHMQNDGKHLALFKLYAFQNDFRVFKLTAKICRKLLIKRYGLDYPGGIINQYFTDRNHPLIPLFRGLGDILKC